MKNREFDGPFRRRIVQNLNDNLLYMVLKPSQVKGEEFCKIGKSYTKKRLFDFFQTAQQYTSYEVIVDPPLLGDKSRTFHDLDDLIEVLFGIKKEKKV